MFSRRILPVVVVVAVASFGAGFVLIRKHQTAEYVAQQQQQLAATESDIAVAPVVEPPPLPVEQKLPAGNFVIALQKLGLTNTEASTASSAAQHVFNLRQVRAGNPITIERTTSGSLREIDYKIDSDRLLQIAPQDVDSPTNLFAKIAPISSTLETTALSGRIDDSLFNALQQSGGSPELTMRLAQIFGYDLDFYTDPRKGDTFRVVVEKKKYADGKSVAFGRILAAEYNNGNKKYQALLFRDPTGQSAYYTADGKSLQKEFLRSPLKFAAPVTSHFSNARFHPILKVYRAHLGTDYGAPVGTPVQSIGNGKVKFAGRKGGEGNMVDILHNNGYETMYLHLARMYVHVGERVGIGKIIGVVGSTGLSTGPHLDFRILQKGQYKNFEKLGMPPSEPVDKKFWSQFAELRDKWLPILKNPELLTATATPALPGTAAPTIAH
jgi:murein DD-endopeptidase MepM/ murein hydrolase activator NlpD